MALPAEASPQALPAPWTLASDLAILVKPRIVGFVVLSTLVGFVLGSGSRLHPEVLFPTLIGTALVAAGTAVLNQFLERESDGRMRRTAGRPLPSGRVGVQEVHCLGVLLAGSGILYLCITVSLATGLIAGLTAAIYLLLYTPLKRRTTLNTAVGAVAGALPPLGGWVAAAGGLGPGGWALFGILYTWQFPHVLAITWVYREDYARGGFRMLAVSDPGGKRTALRAAAYSLGLIPISLLPTWLGVTGWGYGVSALLSGLAFLGFGVGFWHRRTPHSARLMILASLVYLPLLWLVMLFERML